MDRPFTTLSLCSGVGWIDEGVSAACEYLGWGHRVAAFLEWESYAASVLLARMEDASLESAPVWCGDLGGFDGIPFRGVVDCVVAGLPCQPYSLAGKRTGNSDHRSYGDGDGPIPHAMRIIAECDPAVVFFENVPAWVAGGWFRPVGEELCRMGYTLEDPLFVTAESVGASHRRKRVFVLAHKPESRSRLLSESTGRIDAPDADWSGAELDHTAGPRPDDQIESTNEWRTGQRSGECVSRDGCKTVAVTGSVQRRFGKSRRRSSGGTASGGTGGDVEVSKRTRWRQVPVPTTTVSGSRKPYGEMLPIFAPGPGLGLSGVVDDIIELFRDDPEAAWRRFEAERRNTERWIELLEHSPHLCPKIKPGVHGVFNGQQLVLDASRTDQLRCSGNGVVALQAAVAFVELVRRAGLAK